MGNDGMAERRGSASPPYNGMQERQGSSLLGDGNSLIQKPGSQEGGGSREIRNLESRIENLEFEDLTFEKSEDDSSRREA